MKLLKLPALLLMVAALLFSCGSNASENSGKKEVIAVSKSGNCDKIVKEYDKLVEESIQMAMDALDGKEVDEKKKEEIQKKSDELGKKIEKMGIDGLGGQVCWDEFMEIQQKWAKAALELQKKAMEKASEMMKDYNPE